MIKLENVILPSSEQWMAVIYGARNPYNSWHMVDSEIKYENVRDSSGCIVIGPNDLKLLKTLSKAGTDHRKFMRMIAVYVDITAPLYWWKEFDTYKVGTVANSCSTMHKIAEKEFELDDFSHEKLFSDEDVILTIDDISSLELLKMTIKQLNIYRELYVKYKDSKLNGEDAKDYWWQMIQLLPSSYNQNRTVMLNYEVLANIYKSRKNHKLDEWLNFCEWIKTLPYSELIIGGPSKEDINKSLNAMKTYNNCFGNCDICDDTDCQNTPDKED